MTDQHRLTCQVLVAGGGMAGVCCALAAARCGADVILCQDRPVLGGNASSEVRMHMVGASPSGSLDRGEPLVTEPREGGIIEQIRLESSVRNPQRSASMFDLILYETCRAEPNLRLMLNTFVTDVVTSDAVITEVMAQRPGTEDQFRIRPTLVVDCTGDGRIGAESGASFMEGREGASDFNESLAPATADPGRLGSSILLTARRHDRPMPFVAPSWSRRFTREQLRKRLYATPGEERPSLEYGFWWVESGGLTDTIKNNEQIRDHLLPIVMGIWDHIKNGPPGVSEWDDPFDAAHWALDWFGFVPGKRESRRFRGLHVLTQDDIAMSRQASDAIAYGGWPLDLHPPAGIDAAELAPCHQHPVPHLYDISLSSCISRDVVNLMFAGRNISATHVAFSSTRVMATCAAIGQGVGTAAALAFSRGLLPADAACNATIMHEIQQRLLRDDAFLIGVQNTDPEDLARDARVSASSQAKQGAAEQVIDGQTRSVHGPCGAPPARVEAGTHRWMSNPAVPLPAWIQLEWECPVAVGLIQLVFDTGLHRHLTLTHHDGYAEKMQWGRPQEETVRDYVIQLRNGTRWTHEMRVQGNHQRRRVHRIEPPVLATALRINVLATNGIAEARICEIRVYE